MLTYLIQLDWQIFFLINHLPHNFFTNAVFLFFSFAGFYGLIWFAVALLLFLLDGLDNRREILALILSIIINIVLVELALKNIFGRIRPELALTDEVLKIMSLTSTYSFPSGHAFFAFSGAYILGKQRPHLKILFYIIAFLVSFSRIFLGKHYPADVLAGGVLGYLGGIVAYRLSYFIKPKFQPHKGSP